MQLIKLKQTVESMLLSDNHTLKVTKQFSTRVMFQNATKADTLVTCSQLPRRQPSGLGH